MTDTKHDFDIFEIIGIYFIGERIRYRFVDLLNYRILILHVVQVEWQQTPESTCPPTACRARL